MFLFLFVFCGLARYYEGSRWDNFWDGRKYEQSNEIFSRLCGSHFYSDWLGGFWGEEEMRWKGDYLRLLKRDLGVVGDFNFWCVKILGDHYGGFGRRWRRSYGNEVCRSLSWRKNKDDPLHNVLKEAKYLS